MVHCINLAQKMGDLEFVAKIEAFFITDALKCPPKKRLCMNLWDVIFASLSIGAYYAVPDADASKPDTRRALLQECIRRFDTACQQQIDVTRDEDAQALVPRLSSSCLRCCKHLAYVDRQTLRTA